MLSTNYRNRIVDICCRIMSTDGEVDLDDRIILKSELFSNDGSKKFVAESSGGLKYAKEIGYKVGEELLKKAGPNFKVQEN